ncbi:hypothetical protein B0J13DRAFT_599978 [Dactylonectria estremocensis]|uniref:Uncharacterized protein n=1 Tax=Dactylonectria estremocensis TaxID=1079267 RepID=A0A9P9DC92_9HYPO|nr:hypothetical protein B0J13DRAFT_599978 [Dactylonectria estremocensis]
MANEVKNYFLAPSWDYVTEANAGVTISLWNLVTSPMKMVPPLLAAKSQPKDGDMLKSTKENFEWTREQGGEKKFGIWTKFLQVVGFGLNVGHHRNKSVRFQYKFDTIETREAYPTPEYVAQMVKNPSVAVTGATVQMVENKEIGTDLNITVDATPARNPVSLGPELSLSSNKAETLGFQGPSEFIFAFRLRRVRVNARMEVESDDDEREGTALGEDGEPVSDGFDVLGVEDNDMRASDLDSDIRGAEMEADDNDEKVYVTLPIGRI